MPERIRVGLIGCGAVSAAYLEHAKVFPILDVVACADLNPEAASRRAVEFAVPRVCSVDELLKDESIEMVLNLTVPKAHAPIALRAVAAGKHAYSEKPFGITRKEAKAVIEAAKKRNVRVGCAPDTVLGAGLQTARKLIDEGAIGKPVGFTAFMLCRGHEHWHPSPEFYYEAGGGPMFDMGPYYLTALLNLLGPVKQISAMATITVPERTISSEPKKGKIIPVETPDHICGTMQFENGAIGMMGMSFAVKYASYDGRQPITIFGTEGTMRVPDPNGFDGPVHIRTDQDQDWREIPHQFVTGYARAVGLADMAYAIRSGRRARCDGEQAHAVVDLMEAFLESAKSGKVVESKVRYERPAPMRANLPFGTLDE